MIKFKFLLHDISDELELKRILNFTNTLLIVTASVLSLLSVVKILTKGNVDPNDYFLWSLTGLILIIYLIFKKGKVRLAAPLYILALWTYMTWMAWTNDGVKDSAIVAYIIAIMLAIYIARPWQTLAISLLSITSIWVIFYAENNQIIIPTRDSSLNYSIDLTVILIIAITVVFLNAKSYFLFYNRFKNEFDKRTKAEKNLQIREILYQTIFENANDAIFLMKDGIFFDCNLKTTEIFRCKRGQIIGNTPYHFSPPFQPDGSDSKENAIRKMNAALKGNAQRFEWQHTRLDGSPFDAEVSLNSIEVNGQFLLLAVVRDITQNKKVKNALIESERKIRAIFDLSIPFLGLLTVEGNLIEANRSSLEFAGLQLADVYGKPFWETPWWSHSTIMQERVRSAVDAARNGREVQFDGTHLAKNGTEHHFILTIKPVFDEHSKVVLLLPNGYDITERRKAEEALRRSEEKFNKAFNSSPNAISISNITQGGKVIEINNTFEQKTGFKRSEVLGRTAAEIGILVDSQQYNKLLEILDTGKSIRDIEIEFRNKSGEVGIGLISVDFILLDNETYALSTVVDITERKQAEKALIDSEKNFRSIFNKSKNGIIIVGLDMRILAANHAASELSGFVLDDNALFAGDMLVPDQISHAKERIALLNKGENLSPFEYKVKFKDGHIHIIETESSIMDFYGQNAILMILRDVTQLRQAEHKVMEAIIQTEENERSRIAQDLHDGLGPVLSTIKLYFQVYQDTRDESKKIILNEKLKSTIEEAIKGVSEISHNISPHVLKNYGFYAALKQFIHRISLTNIVKFNLDLGNEPELNQNTGITLYRVILELINNSIKHGGCKNITVAFSYSEDFVQVDYSDDGKGFEVIPVIDRPASGAGVQNIRNRINALGGQVEISSIVGRGMHALLKIPV